MRRVHPITETRACATCGAEYIVNPKYSRAQRERSRYCSHPCIPKSYKAPRLRLQN